MILTDEAWQHGYELIDADRDWRPCDGPECRTEQVVIGQVEHKQPCDDCVSEYLDDERTRQASIGANLPTGFMDSLTAAP